MAITYHAGRRIQGLSLTAGAEIGETSGTDATTFPIGKTGAIYRVGIKIATGSALIGETLSATKGIQFELKRTGLTGSDIVAFEIWSADGTRVLRDTYDADTKLPTTSFAYIEFKPSQTVTLAVGYRVLFVADGGTTNYVDMRTNTSGTYDTTKTHLTYSSNDDGSGTPAWTDETGKDPNFKFTLADVGDAKPTNVQVGSRYEETDTRKIYYRIDSDYETDKWFELGTAPYAGGRGVFGGGSDGSITNTMEYITISTPSNATDFGDLTVARTYVEAVSSITRGVFGGGYGSADENTMDYITFATPSNATDFGNLTVARHALAGVSSGTRGVFGGGNGSNVMDYITIATPSNATDFGDLTVTRQDLAGVSSDTRGVFAGGDGSNVMDYITISTPSNATDFGDLLTNLRYPADVSNGTRGVFAGGDPNSGSGNTNVIQYITIASTGNATDFGDLTVGRHAPAGVESDTRGVIGGGYSGGNSNVMDYITIATTGNATDFGDLTAATNHLGGASRF